MPLYWLSICYEKAVDVPNKNQNFTVQNLKKVVYFLNC